MKGAVRWAARLLVTALVTYFLFRAVRLSLGDLRALEEAKWTPRAPVLALSIVLLLAAFSYHVGLWVRLLRQRGVGSLALLRAVRIFFVAQLGRYVPGKVWQIAGLAYLTAREGLPAAPAAFVAVLSQVWTLAGAGLIGALYLGFGPPGRWLWSAVSAAVVLAGTLLLLGNRTLNARLMAIVTRRAKSPPSSPPPPSPAQPLKAGPGTTLAWLGLYALAWLAYGAAFCALWAAFRPLPAELVPLAATAFPAAYLIGYLAFFAPAGIGVREGALAALTAPVLGAADATGLALIARLWITVTELIPLTILIPRTTGTRARGVGDG